MEKNKKKNDNLNKKKKSSQNKEEKQKKTVKKSPSSKTTFSKKKENNSKKEILNNKSKVIKTKEDDLPSKNSGLEKNKISFLICFGIILIIVILVFFLMQDNAITGDDAKDIAMQDLSQITTSAVFNSIEYEKDNDVVIYIVEFSDTTYKYTYKVNSKTKEIINFVKKRLN